MSVEERLEDYLKGYQSQYNFVGEDKIEHTLNSDIKSLLKENQELKEEINKISKKELKVRDMLYSIEYGTLTRERLNQIEEVLFELGGDVDDE